MNRSIDFYIIDDSIDVRLLTELETMEAPPPDSSIVVVLDHAVPSNSVETTRRHNRLRRLAQRWGCLLHDGQGVAQPLIAETCDLSDALVVSAGGYVSGCKAVGAHTAELAPDEFLAALRSGVMEWQTGTSLELKVSGSSQPLVQVRDIVLHLASQWPSARRKAGHLALSGDTCFNRTELMQAHTGLRDAGILASCPADEGGVGAAGGDGDAIVAECTLKAVSPMVSDGVKVAPVTHHAGQRIDQGFVGGCLGGSIEDLRIVARLLDGKDVAKRVDLIISPFTQGVYTQALEEGLVNVFLDSGAIVVNPNCSACAGFHQGVIGSSEVMISTGAARCRNSRANSGRVFYASAATVTASCIAGSLAEPTLTID